MLGSKAIVTEHPYVTHCRRYLAEAQRDPLFSAPHLKDFLEYLSEPSPQWPVDDKPFTWPYPRPMINDHRRSSDTRSNSFDIPEKVTRDHESLGLLFLSGYPSSRWLKDVGEKYKVDMHFFQQHLSSIRPSVHVDVFAEPSLPSSSGHTLKLKIPTIGYLGDTGDSFRDMSRTRSLLVEDLRQQILNNAQRHPVGQPIVRDVYLHNQEHFTLLQEVSMCLLRDKNMWTVLIWTDAGYEDKDPDLSFLFKRAPNMLHIAPKLCPTVFNRPIRFGESVYSSVASSDVRFNATQVFNSLHKAYGKTLDPHLTSQDPFYAVSEVYSFAAAAENQFLNMMRNILDNRIESIVRESLQSKNSTHDALPERANIQYDRTILDAHSDRISNVIAFLKAADDPVWFPNVDHHDRREAVRARTSLVHDFQHLQAQTIQLIQRCERAMDMVAYNASLLEAKRSNLQSEGLEKLTRLTTIVTLLYVPLSFVCTFFGMNFSTFGQGKLSLWIWAAVSAPVMLISLGFLRRMLKNDSKKTRP